MSAKHPQRTELAKFICKEIMDDDWGLGKQLCLGYADEILAMLAAPELLDALGSLRSFVAVMIGRGADATIPETIATPIGVPIKIGDIMRDATDAIAKAEGHPLQSRKE